MLSTVRAGGQSLGADTAFHYSFISTAKPELKNVDESDDACYHYMYVLTKNVN
jgi:hypothetical protein